MSMMSSVLKSQDGALFYLLQKMSSNGGEDAVDGTIEKKDEDALVESVKKVEISEDSKEVEKKASTEEPGDFHFTNCSPYNTCTQIRQF